jgi:sporulation protein YlmC with PRC-barrel domain
MTTLRTQLKAGALAALVAGLIAATASAQEPAGQGPERARPPGSVDIARAERPPATQGYREYLQGHEARVSKLVGADVLSAGGDKVGEIDEVLLPAAVSAPATVVVSVGGVLGVGEKLIAMPLDDLKVSKEDEIYIDRTTNQLEAEPAFKYGQTETGAPSRSALSGAGNRVAGLVGATVMDSSGKDIGEIDDVLISAKPGAHNRAVLSIGGLAGIGDKLVALPFENLQITRTVTAAEDSPKAPEVRVNMAQDVLKELPTFEYDQHSPQDASALR